MPRKPSLVGLSPVEQELLSKLTLFQAQVLRDALEERTETDAQIAERMNIPEEVVLLSHSCRIRSIVPPEVPIAEVREIMKTYKSPFADQRLKKRGVARPPETARAVTRGRGMGVWGRILDERGE